MDSLNKAKNLLAHKKYGVLSTHSAEMEGYPFGSLTPYCFDRNGHLLIYVSKIAQHTKNILKNPKVSLTVTSANEDNVLTGERLTYLAVAETLNSEDTDSQERYFRFFPKSKNYQKTHNFSFFRLKPTRIRYIGGFGKIFWFETEDLIHKNPFEANQEKRILEHMNKDHQKALCKYLKKFKNIDPLPETQILMAGIDSRGFDINYQSKSLRFELEQEIQNPSEARAALVALAK